MKKPVVPNQTDAWLRLAQLKNEMVPDLRAWFASDRQRVEKFTYQAGDLHIDLSKNLINEDLIKNLLDLAEETDVLGRRDRMFAGDHINNTENRAVLHTALRRPETDKLAVDGQEVIKDVHATLKRVYQFAQRVRNGEWTGISGKTITHIVNIGIGGSDLGPVMVYEALKPYVKEGIECRFVSNIDPTDVAQKTADLDPERTLFIVASKTFTTLETLTNARLARTWLLDSLHNAGALEGKTENEAVAAHFVAVSTALDKVREFGIDPANAFGFWDWVGGRYSVDSAIGTVLAIALGPENFTDFLAGFNLMDTHFATAPAEENIPLLMGMLNIWYVNFFQAASHAVLPYAQQLHRFPAYLQQLTMESNGKSVRWDGEAVDYQTGEIFWGEPGTNGQHAFYQLIHQGTQLVPADFIAFANPAYPLKDGEKDVHELFLANFFAQTKALAFGKTAEEVRAEGTPEEIVPARVFTGNKPSTSIMAPALTPSVMGQLIALYEHITFVEGAVWGVNSYDQWGVELGKQLALQIYPAITGDETAYDAQDDSTRSLISYYRSHRD
ncbi:glucose-6-phosphate isomerase [Actinomycetaceae bacterium TAE3-ERU4]|nr:glucose-6-phosphate isomerase [Actinomycetaceae bacterium TAE3-ERU4]